MSRELIKTFIELVQIDSPSGEESRVRDYVRACLNNLGIKSTVDKAGNLFAKVNGEGETLLLSCHLDTVEPGRGVKPNIRSGVIVSDGTTILGADNKIAVAVILDTLRLIRDKSHHPLELVFSVREETDGGISEFDFDNLKSKIGLVADRASEIGSIVVSSPWIMNISIKIIGRSAHAGTPEMGINALSAAAEALNKITLGRVDKYTTTNFGLINGGSAMNTVPEIVELTGEVRSFSKISFNKTRKVVHKSFESLKKSHGVDLVYDEHLYCSGYNYEESDPAVMRIVEKFNKLNINTIFEKSFGASDANSFVQRGIKVVNIGDGGQNPHTLDESVSVANLEKLSNFFVSYVSRE